MKIQRGSGVATGRTWTVLLAAADTRSGGLKRPFSHVHTGCRSPAGGAAGAGGRAARLRLAAGAILCARFRPTRVLALRVGPSQPAPLALVHVHAPAVTKLLLFLRFKRFGLFFGEIDADLHCFGRLAKPSANHQPPKGGTGIPAWTPILRKNLALLSLI